MSAIEVIGGDFEQDRRSRFESTAMVLYRRFSGTSRTTKRSPSDLVAFRVRDGVWARVFDDAGEWTRALATAGVAGVPLAGANLFIPTFFFGQQAVLTWANAMIGAAAAAATMKSDRLVRFEARFGEGEVLHAKAKERALMARLPHFYRALARREK